MLQIEPLCGYTDNIESLCQRDQLHNDLCRAKQICLANMFRVHLPHYGVVACETLTYRVALMFMCSSPS